MKTITTKRNEARLRESFAIRGVCAAIQAMSLPTIASVNRLLQSAGYNVRIRPVTAQNEQHEENI